MTLLQSDLFTQRENLDRVQSALACNILLFIELRVLGNERVFHMNDLTNFIRDIHPNIAPDSAGRILRQLRQQGRCNYKVENRRASLYRVIA
jgi:hypothetical protein